MHIAIGDKTFMALKTHAERREIKISALIRNILADFVEQHGLARRSRPTTVSTRVASEISPDERYEPEDPFEADDFDDLDLVSEEDGE